MTPCIVQPKILEKMFKKATSLIVAVSFLLTSFSLPKAYAQGMPFMPKPGVMVFLSPQFKPAHILGLSIHPDNALMFDFLMYKGDQPLGEDIKKDEYSKLIKYFLASLTIPDEDQWVNLSPYEKQRTISDSFGKTAMGRDLLAQDYMLKQITASLIYPEKSLGQKFWGRVYERAQKEFGTSNIPVNTFNKVWIVPDEADVYESGNSVYILKSHLKVMLEEDYLSLDKHSGMGVIASPEKQDVIASPEKQDVIASPEKQDVIASPEKQDVIARSEATKQSDNAAHALGSKIVREIILPELDREVNEGKNFAALRQIYSSMILATWYKQSLKKSLLGQIYADKAKVKGVELNASVIASPDEVGTKQSRELTNEQIYQQYIKAFKKGVFNYIKEDVDRYTQEQIPRKYFSGGFHRADMTANRTSQAMRSYNLKDRPPVGLAGEFARIAKNSDLVSAAMNAQEEPQLNQSAAMMAPELEKYYKKVPTPKANLELKGITFFTGEGLTWDQLVYGVYGKRTDRQTVELVRRIVSQSGIEFQDSVSFDPKAADSVLNIDVPSNLYIVVPGVRYIEYKPKKPYETVRGAFGGIAMALGIELDRLIIMNRHINRIDARRLGAGISIYIYVAEDRVEAYEQALQKDAQYTQRVKQLFKRGTVLVLAVSAVAGWAIGKRHRDHNPTRQPLPQVQPAVQQPAASPSKVDFYMFSDSNAKPYSMDMKTFILVTSGDPQFAAKMARLKSLDDQIRELDVQLSLQSVELGKLPLMIQIDRLKLAKIDLFFEKHGISETINAGFRKPYFKMLNDHDKIDGFSTESLLKEWRGFKRFMEDWSGVGISSRDLLLSKVYDNIVKLNILYVVQAVNAVQQGNMKQAREYYDPIPKWVALARALAAENKKEKGLMGNRGPYTLEDHRPMINGIENAAEWVRRAMSMNKSDPRRAQYLNNALELAGLLNAYKQVPERLVPPKPGSNKVKKYRGASRDDSYKKAREIVGSQFDLNGNYKKPLIASNTKGGIDLNAANMNLKIKRDGNGVPLPLNLQDMEKLRSIEGFVPVILKITPVIAPLPVLSELQQTQPSA